MTARVLNMPESAPTSIYQGQEYGFPTNLYGKPSSGSVPTEQPTPLAQHAEQSPDKLVSPIVKIGLSAGPKTYAHQIAANITFIGEHIQQSPEVLRPAA